MEAASQLGSDVLLLSCVPVIGCAAPGQAALGGEL